MNKNIQVIFSLIILFLLVMIPNISAIEFKMVNNMIDNKVDTIRDTIQKKIGELKSKDNELKNIHSIFNNWLNNGEIKFIISILIILVLQILIIKFILTGNYFRYYAIGFINSLPVIYLFVIILTILNNEDLVYDYYFFSELYAVAFAFALFWPFTIWFIVWYPSLGIPVLFLVLSQIISQMITYTKSGPLSIFEKLDVKSQSIYIEGLET